MFEAKIPLIQLDEYKAQQAQQLLNQAVNEIISVPVLNGRLLENVQLASGSNDVEHKLNRVPVGYIIVRRSANQNLHDTSLNNRTLTLNASGAVTVSLWVF